MQVLSVSVKLLASTGILLLAVAQSPCEAQSGC